MMMRPTSRSRKMLAGLLAPTSKIAAPTIGGGDKDGDKNDRRDNKRPDEEDKTEEERDKDPRHAYKDPDRSVRSIFGGKVALENGQQRKLTARAIMALNNSDEKVADPKYQNWSHQPITFSRAD
jgi:hypothetical protein